MSKEQEEIQEGMMNSLNSQDENGVTPLHHLIQMTMFFAVTEGYASVTEQMIEERCDVDRQEDDGDTPLIITAQNGHASVTNHLIEAHCHNDLPDTDANTPPRLGENGHVCVTKKLIEAHCNINLQNKNGITPLFVAAAEGHTSVTK